MTFCSIKSACHTDRDAKEPVFLSFSIFVAGNPWLDPDGPVHVVLRRVLDHGAGTARIAAVAGFEK